MALRRDHCKPENRLPPAVGHMQIGIFKHIVGNRTVVGNHAVNQADRFPVLKKDQKAVGKDRQTLFKAFTSSHFGLWEALRLNARKNVHVLRRGGT